MLINAYFHRKTDARSSLREDDIMCLSRWLITLVPDQLKLWEARQQAHMSAMVLHCRTRPLSVLQFIADRWRKPSWRWKHFLCSVSEHWLPFCCGIFSASVQYFSTNTSSICWMQKWLFFVSICNISMSLLLWGLILRRTSGQMYSELVNGHSVRLRKMLRRILKLVIYKDTGIKQKFCKKS